MYLNMLKHYLRDFRLSIKYYLYGNNYRIVIDNFCISQEKLKWQKQQDEFDRRKREHQMNLVEMERKEVQRREEELRQRKHLLEEKKRKHAKIEK